jgi:hypothetical protein
MAGSSAGRAARREWEGVPPAASRASARSRRRIESRREKVVAGYHIRPPLIAAHLLPIMDWAVQLFPMTGVTATAHLPTARGILRRRSWVHGHVGRCGLLLPPESVRPGKLDSLSRIRRAFTRHRSGGGSRFAMRLGWRLYVGTAATRVVPLGRARRRQR